MEQKHHQREDTAAKERRHLSAGSQLHELPEMCRFAEKQMHSCEKKQWVALSGD